MFRIQHSTVQYRHEVMTIVITLITKVTLVTYISTHTHIFPYTYIYILINRYVLVYIYVYKYILIREITYIYVYTYPRHYGLQTSSDRLFSLPRPQPPHIRCLVHDNCSFDACPPGAAASVSTEGIPTPIL